MVIATKSIFETMADEPDILQLFKKMNRALKRLNLRKHYMALQVVKIKDYFLEVCAAGMPPLLLYRAATKRVEPITIKAMPLGSVAEFPYQKQEMALAPGDTILLMSDGFAELFSQQAEMFDDDRVKTAFTGAAQLSPKQIIEHLVCAGEAWAKGNPHNDDMTFVVLKVR